VHEAKQVEKFCEPLSFMGKVGTQAFVVSIGSFGHVHFVPGKDDSIETVGAELAKLDFVRNAQRFENPSESAIRAAFADVMQAGVEAVRAALKRVEISAELLARFKEQNASSSGCNRQSSGKTADATANDDDVEMSLRCARDTHEIQRPSLGGKVKIF
jgi:hypothetical protein